MNEEQFGLMVADWMGRIGWVLVGACVTAAIIVLATVAYHTGRATVRRIRRG